MASTSTTSTSTGDVTARISEWKLAPTDLQADLDKGTTIVRTKQDVAGAPTGTTDDSVIESMVKGKIQADPQTANAMIDVSAHNGEVSLKGSADSATILGRAIALALDTQGVTKVSSDVKVNAQAK
jgi:osmotically-inducible protein OsmY